ncbi:MAG: glycerophosphodiester phosphodiesterase [Burkholderiales bacterium]|nr:glycerophosphodiester phosphodiesterase [Burkholderiales bacterium]
MNLSLNVIASLVAATLLAACGGSNTNNVTPATPVNTLATLDGKAPLVLAHRGASAYFPEETLEAYTLAIAMGVDVIEPDLVLTKDGVLVARHDVTLSASTDVANHPEFASRKRAGENGDGEAVAADWFTADFTLAELKTLRARSPNHDAAKRYNDQFKIATFQEILDLIKLKASENGRTVGIYPETKNPSYHLALTKSGALPVRLEDALFKAIKDNNLNSKDAPIFVQSFEPGSLKYLRQIGSLTKQIQLIDAYDVDFKTGKMIYGTAPGNLVYSQPTDWKLAGDTRLFDGMLTPAGLAEIKAYADGIGAWKPMLIPVKCALDAAGACKDVDGDASFNGYADSTMQAPTSVVADAHKAGLFVHVYTFRNEKGYYNQPFDAKGDASVELQAFYALGVDGVFSDSPDTALKARSSYLSSLGK